jgi:hypothetical protein
MNTTTTTTQEEQPIKILRDLVVGNVVEWDTFDGVAQGSVEQTTYEAVRVNGRWFNKVNGTESGIRMVAFQIRLTAQPKALQDLDVGDDVVICDGALRWLTVVEQVLAGAEAGDQEVVVVGWLRALFGSVDGSWIQDRSGLEHRRMHIELPTKEDYERVAKERARCNIGHLLDYADPQPSREAFDRIEDYIYNEIHG